MFNEVCLVLCFVLLLSTPAQLRRTCSRALDVVFLLNSGPDIPDNDWNLMTRLARDIAYYLHPSMYGSHVAHVQFAGNTSVVHGFRTELVIGDRSESFQTGRNLFDAIDTTRRLVLNNADGDRPEVPDVIVLITHGLSDDKNKAVAEATRAKSDGIRIITVGMTNTVVDQLREELKQVATHPSDVDGLMFMHSSHFSPVFSALLRTVCRNRVEADSESIRLVDGTANTGRLEVYIEEEWLTFCSISWTDLNTKIACKQLGFLDGQAMYTMNQAFYHRRTGIANIQCRGNENKLLHCPHDSFFHINSSCDHRRDVFLRCLCNECSDYSPSPFTVRLADRTPISGRLQVFSLGTGWGEVCSDGWTASNTRVACRQLGFIDGAGTYRPNNRQSITFRLFNVRCVGNESLLFECTSSTSPQPCTDPIHIRCECNHCPESLLQEPHQQDATTQSTAMFEWRFKQNITAFEILFLSQKNPQTLMNVEDGNVVVENNRFKQRIQLINDDDPATVGFKLAKITTADMGIYALYVPELVLSSKSILIVTDFGVVPDAVINRQVHESVKLSWDLRALRQLRDIHHEVFLTTPATGRLHLAYYYSDWLSNNPRRHRVPQSRDHLHPTIIIDDLVVKDAGNYVTEVTLTSPVYVWLNSSWQFVTDLVVDANNPPHKNKPDDNHQFQSSTPDYVPSWTSTPEHIFPSQTSTLDHIVTPETGNGVLFALIIVSCVLFSLSVLAIVVVIRVCNKKVHELKSEKKKHSRRRNDRRIRTRDTQREQTLRYAERRKNQSVRQSPLTYVNPEGYTYLSHNSICNLPPFNAISQKNVIYSDVQTRQADNEPYMNVDVQRNDSDDYEDDVNADDYAESDSNESDTLKRGYKLTIIKEPRSA